jgi:hypothetical protein
MKAPKIHRFVALFLVTVLLVPQSWAICGGGGGGGMGGMGGGMGGGMSAQTYPVPWKIVKPQDTLKDGLAVYWLPSSQKELENSSLK